MTKMEKPTTLSRRAVLMGTGALVVSVGAPIGVETMLGINEAFAQGAKPPLTPDQLSSYIAVNADGTVDAYFGKMDMGHGSAHAIGQIVAEELDVPFKAVKVYMGDTATSVNQGGASGSTGIQLGGKQMRMAAAEARRVLVEMAAAQLGSPADQLIVIDGASQRGVQPRQEGVLCRADRRQVFQRPARLEQEIRQPALCPRQGQAERPQASQDRRPADQARRRGAEGVRAGKLLHRHQGAGHAARPHDPAGGGRRGAGQGRRKLDQGHPGRAGGAPGGLPRRGRADNEWDAIQAAQKLKVEWSEVKPPFPDQNALYDHIRKAPARKREVGEERRQCRRGVQDRGQGDRGRIRMAVPVARRDGTGLRAGRDQGRQGHMLERHAEVAFRPAGRRGDTRHAGRERPCEVDARAGLLRPQRRRRRRDGRRRAGEGGRQAGARAIHAQRGHRLGPEGPGLDPHRAGGARRHRATSSPTTS